MEDMRKLETGVKFEAKLSSDFSKLDEEEKEL